MRREAEALKKGGLTRFEGSHAVVKIRIQSPKESRSIGLRLNKTAYDRLKEISKKSGVALGTTARIVLEKVLAEGVEVES